MMKAENAMSTLLHIDSSPMGEDSLSRRLTREFVRRWRLQNPQGRVIRRDLALIEIPVIDATWVAANYTRAESRTQQQNDLLALSTEFTRELLEAEEYVMGVPMHNWGPAASFKLWVDQIVRFGRTVLITPTGIRGILDNKRATLFVTAGRRYDPASENASRNHLGPWLRTFFESLGVRDMQLVFVDGTTQVKNGNIEPAAFFAPYRDGMESLLPQATASSTH
jgi:FMN-dependent NADH-azoreductase